MPNMATYYGDSGNNYIGPYSGPNTIFGGAGNDTLEGYTDNDRLDGEDGNDLLLGWFGNDSLYGGNGSDTLYGEDNNDLLSGGEGNDYLLGGNNNDTLYGNAGNDILWGDDDDLYSGSDVLAGGAGDDTLFGGGESDFYIFTFYGDGKDYIYDSSGSYDELRINGVSNLSGLQFFRATAFGSTNDNNDLVIRRAGDTAMSEYIVVDDYWSGSAAGAGRIEYLNVNGSYYWFNDVTSSL